MFKELNRLLNDTKDFELNERFLNSIIDIMMSNESELSDFISRIDFKNDLDGLGVYDCDLKIIGINYEGLLKLPIENEIKKVVAIQVLRHEMEHARNLKRLYDGRCDIESMVIKYSLVGYIKKVGLNVGLFIDENDAGFLSMRNSHNYDINPGERIADIKSYKFVVNMLKNKRNSKELMLMRSMLYNFYIRGYKDNRYYLDAPTYTYLLNMGMFQDYNILKQTVDLTDYSLDTRALCGLPITYQEKDELLLKRAFGKK